MENREKIKKEKLQKLKTISKKVLNVYGTKNDKKNFK